MTAHGNLTRKTVTQPHAVAAVPTRETTSYRYNAYDQLIESRVFTGGETSGEPLTVTSYEVGVTGSVTREAVTENGVVSVREFDYSALGQTTAVVTDGVRALQEYDGAGNLTRAADGTQYAYDVRNRLVSSTSPDGGVVSETTYWAGGKRKNVVERSVGEEPTVTGFYWDGSTLINETLVPKSFDSAHIDQAVSSYVFGLTRIARTLSSGAGAEGADRWTEYYVSDRHGSTAALTSSVGDLTTSYGYTDYGQTITHGDVGRQGVVAGNRFQYSGEYTNVNDGTQELGSRRYNPKAFAFNTCDTAPLYNLYAYGNANPITMVDPTGQDADDDWGTTGAETSMGLVAAGITFGLTLLMDLATLRTVFHAGLAGVSGLTDMGIALTQIADTLRPDLNLLDNKTSQNLSDYSVMASVVVLALGLRLTESAMWTSVAKATWEPFSTDFMGQLQHSFVARAARMTKSSKTNARRTYYHGTDGFSAQSIVNGVRNMRFVENAQLRGRGFYVTRSPWVANAYRPRFYGKTVAVHLSPQSPVKIFPTDDGWRAANPAVWKKDNGGEIAAFEHSPTWEDAFSAVDDLTNNYGVDVVHIARTSHKEFVITKNGFNNNTRRIMDDDEWKRTLQSAM